MDDDNKIEFVTVTAKRWDKERVFVSSKDMLNAMKPLTSKDALVFPKVDCIIPVRQVREWLRLTDPLHSLAIEKVHAGCIGFKNGNSYAQFINRPRLSRTKKYDNYVRLQFDYRKEG